jgi:hypothetical protein
VSGQRARRCARRALSSGRGGVDVEKPIGVSLLSACGLSADQWCFRHQSVGARRSQVGGSSSRGHTRQARRAMTGWATQSFIWSSLLRQSCSQDAAHRWLWSIGGKDGADDGGTGTGVVGAAWKVASAGRMCGVGHLRSPESARRGTAVNHAGGWQPLEQGSARRGLGRRLPYRWAAEEGAEDDRWADFWHAAHAAVSEGEGGNGSPPRGLLPWVGSGRWGRGMGLRVWPVRKRKKVSDFSFWLFQTYRKGINSGK